MGSAYGNSVVLRGYGRRSASDPGVGLTVPGLGDQLVAQIGGMDPVLGQLLVLIV